ncbi:ribonuclease P protein component [Amylibacter ulvae]|uniref:Ribonuclease P protein component n=1 Tax=Paramylibacter ulvae TaxID=1651968 RepID=A0ABQ3D3X7_9RHOB|nr:ribonuclease P protein component [Amylibacter ulvae]GHA50133.1 ribonuclease P protein component [Amylibacter ulvae]
MKPPEATISTPQGAGGTPPAVSVCLQTIKKRADFLACSRANWRGTTGLVLQARDRKDDDTSTRVGFTCSKKVGNAVARNRAKRRLREVARIVLSEKGRAGWDYVLIGKSQVTANRDFNDLIKDMRYALKKVHE